MILNRLGSEPAGFDTVVFTATQLSQVASSVIGHVSTKWPGALVEIEMDGIILRQFRSKVTLQPIIETLQGEHVVITCAANEEMTAFFQAHSYEVMANGEGPISYHIRKRHNILFELPRLIEIRQDDNPNISTNPYKSWLCSDVILELTAVTPGDPAINSFSDWAVQVLFKSCLGQ